MSISSSFNLKNKNLFIALHLTFWVVASALFIVITGSFYDTQTAVLRTLANIIHLAILFYGNALFFVNRFLEKKRYFAYTFYTFIFFMVILVLRVQCNSFFPDNFYEPFITSETRAYIFTSFTSLGVFSFSVLYQVLINRAAAERKTMETINQYNEAQIQFLKAQINPHFLFNTLNNIYSLAVAKSDDTPEMILKLSDLLRYVIYKGEEQQVDLENEVIHIYKFIELFQMRSEEDLDIRLTVEGKIEHITIEPMILIPLIENCFKHCDFDTNEDAFIEMNLIIEKNQLIFKTLNSKNDSDTQKDKTGGVGLSNIQKRLKLNYPDRYKLVMENQEKSFKVYLEMQLN